MDSFYIFQYCADQKEKQNLSLVIFCSGLSIDIGTLKDRLRDFFRKNSPPKKIFVIGGEYLKNELIKTFLKNKSGLFDVIPNYLTKDEEIKLIYFDSNGRLINYLNDKTINESEQLIKAGIFNIFNLHGGLIEAPSETYHYVFPSGKHSTRFIRAGNVLVHGAEILFIATTFLKWIKPNISHIYCDTSSINSLAYAILELKRRFSPKLTPPTIVSFGSYEKFENFDFKDSRNSLIIVSASTSGRIIKRLLERHPNLRKENIIVLFYLSNDVVDSNVICDLTYEPEKFLGGFNTDEMYENEVDCKFCKNGSYTVKISGDIFLLEKPKINTLTINKSDAPGFLSRFMQKFHSQNKTNLIRCYYGEDQTRKFEIFFKADALILGLNKLKGNFLIKEEFIKKIDKTLYQHVPSGLKAIIYLDDNGSKLISQRILNDCNSEQVKLLSSKEFINSSDIKIDDAGAILVVCSCLVTGNNLLYINKYLRRFQNMTKTFFVMFARTENNQSFDFIKKNIGQGEFGISTNHFTHIEKITCSPNAEFSNSKPSLSWSFEIDLFKQLLHISDESPEFSKAKKYLTERLQVLEKASDQANGGLINNVFLKNPVKNKTLKINKNFAFFDFDGYHNQANQADIYFTISTILNHLRNSSDLKKGRIIQEEQVRTIIDPGNFIRFDDGIIQASILRSATADELNYKLSYKHSNQVTLMLFKMVDNYKDSLSSEALIEFLFAFAIKKLRINDTHMVSILDRIDLKVSTTELLLFSFFIRQELRLK